MMKTTTYNPKIIAVFGPANYGKTSVIKKIFALLDDGCAAQVEKCSKGNDDNDICKIVTIRDVTIGIKSAGDDPQDVKDALAEFVKRGCQLIICATRTKSGTVHAVCAYDGLPRDEDDKSDKDANVKHMVEWHAPITLQYPDIFGDANKEINRANERIALTIFNEIQEFINFNEG